MILLPPYGVDRRLGSDRSDGGGRALNDDKALVGVPASSIEIRPEGYRVHATGSTCIQSVARFSRCLPVILPALGERSEAESVAARIDGLLLTGGRANVEPHHYGGEPFPEDECIDPDRDNTVLPLVRACVEAEVPVFGICRGIQELNVALGGTLHYRVHQVPGMDDHRMPRRENLTAEEVFALRHPVRLASGGSFERLVGRSEVLVNSLHGQGIARLAECLEVEARSPDGVIEGVRLRRDPTFTVGVQWHAEWKPEEHALSRALFRELGAAARRRAARRYRAPLAHLEFRSRVEPPAARSLPGG